MACFSPLRGYQRDSGGRVSFVPVRNGRRLDLPCGQCIGCRLEYSRQWAIRCVHESECWNLNCFITLTYDDKHLPEGRTLVPRDFELFMKSLRELLRSRGLGEVRFFMCGEYGDLNGRPHYHACIFNFDFPDKVLWRDGQFKVYRSKMLEDLWGKGFCSVGSVSFESAAYVARYVAKKVTGAPAKEHYRSIDGDGVVLDRVPEYCRMSNGGGKSNLRGIGFPWLRRFYRDVFPQAEVVSRARLVKPPRYYEKWFRDCCTPREFKRLQLRRREKADKAFDDNSTARLGVRRVVTEARFKLFHREL